MRLPLTSCSHVPLFRTFLSSFPWVCSTSSMAADALALMDHLAWTKAHIVGHSMGEGDKDKGRMVECDLTS